MKPATSKGGNSEVYVACMGYRGRDVVTSEHLLFLQEAIGMYLQCSYCPGFCKHSLCEMSTRFD